MLAAAFAVLIHSVAFGAELNWEVKEVAPGGRIDAVAYLGEGVVIAASRNPKPGHVFRSADVGRTWTDSGNLLGDDPIASSISCLASGGRGIAYFLTGDGQVWKSEDWGANWNSFGQVTRNPRHLQFLHSYGIAVLPSGTVLVSDTNPTGGHIFRSENGGKDWQDIGIASPMALYRFETTPDGVLVNGWAGHVYKSIDDGRSWTDKGRLSESALYATTYLENGVALQGAEDGRLYRSVDHGETWAESVRLDGAADDFAYMGGGVVLYSTYTSVLNLYLSRDHGKTWKTMGPVPTGAPEDVLDHFVPVTFEGKTYVVGGSKKGYLLRVSLREPGE